MLFVNVIEIMLSSVNDNSLIPSHIETIKSDENMLNFCMLSNYMIPNHLHYINIFSYLNQDEENKSPLLPDLFTTREILFEASPLQTENYKSTLNMTAKGLRIAHLNICHLLPKVDEIKLLLSKPVREVDILGLTETFLTSNNTDPLINIENYNLERKDRLGKKGGGIVTYISNVLEYERRKDLETS